MQYEERKEEDMSNDITLTAIVIAKNEEKRIATCLDSIAFADEIILIDNGSDDSTVAIAKKYHARVIEELSHNFSTLRNRGKEEAKGMWILYIDADEVVTEALREEILNVIKDQRVKINAYYIKRCNYYLGHKWPVGDKMQRLFRKESLVAWQGKLHETAVIKGAIGILHESLVHDTHRTLEEMVEKTNEWSEVEAKLRYDAHHPPVVWWRFFRVMWTGFSHSFFREGGWRAGTVGWIESIYQGFSMFLTYAKLWEMQEKKSS